MLRKYTPEETVRQQHSVNTLYWLTNCSLARISRHLGIGLPRIRKLLVPREVFLAD